MIRFIVLHNRRKGSYTKKLEFEVVGSRKEVQQKLFFGLYEELYHIIGAKETPVLLGWGNYGGRIISFEHKMAKRTTKAALMQEILRVLIKFLDDLGVVDGNE